MVGEERATVGIVVQEKGVMMLVVKEREAVGKSYLKLEYISLKIRTMNMLCLQYTNLSQQPEYSFPQVCMSW